MANSDWSQVRGLATTGLSRDGYSLSSLTQSPQNISAV